MTTVTELDLAAQVLDLVRAAAGPGAQAEVTVERRALALTRFADSRVHQNVEDGSTTVRLRAHLAGRTASGSTTVTTGEAIGDLVERTISASRLCPPDPGWPGLAPAAPLAGTGTVDPDIVDAVPADRAERVRAFVNAAEGLTTAGYCRTTHATVAFANSAGQVASGGYTEAALDAIARTGSADGLARMASSRLADIDGAVLGARAAAKALAGSDPVELPPGRYEVVLEPTAVADVLSCLAGYGFSGRAFVERRSFVALGHAQFDPSVTLVDDGVSPGLIGMPFDHEGTPKRALTLVRQGVSEAVTHDRRTARMTGTASTGHAPAPGEGAGGPVPTNMTLLPGPGPAPEEVPGPAADSAVAALVAGVPRGLLVTDHWYTRVLDPRTLVMTGLTRNGVWLIEDGEIVRPVRNLRFTQSYPQALAPDAVLGIGSGLVTHPAAWGFSSHMAPALRLASWNFTGGARG